MLVRDVEFIKEHTIVRTIRQLVACMRWGHGHDMNGWLAGETSQRIRLIKNDENLKKLRWTTRTAAAAAAAHVPIFLP